jgi:hypothetical protein
MLGLKPIIERIRKLLDEGTPQSVTYAALEARLALEKVCYDRLRQRHDYISHEQLKKWQPGGVMNQLITDVDAHATQTLTLQIGSPVSAGVKPEDDEYVEIGTEIGFDVKQPHRVEGISTGASQVVRRRTFVMSAMGGKRTLAVTFALPATNARACE